MNHFILFSFVIFIGFCNLVSKNEAAVLENELQIVDEKEWCECFDENREQPDPVGLCLTKMIVKARDNVKFRGSISISLTRVFKLETTCGSPLPTIAVPMGWDPEPQGDWETTTIAADQKSFSNNAAIGTIVAFVLFAEAILAISIASVIYIRVKIIKISDI